MNVYAEKTDKEDEVDDDEERFAADGDARRRGAASAQQATSPHSRVEHARTTTAVRLRQLVLVHRPITLHTHTDTPARSPHIAPHKGQIPLRHPASQPARQVEFCLSRAILLASSSLTGRRPAANLPATGRKPGL